MCPPLTAPDADDLAVLGLDTWTVDEPWVRSVSFPTEDQGDVTVTWDEIAGSVHVRWAAPDGRRVVEVTRETVERVAVTPEGAGHRTTVTSTSDGIAGRLVVTVTPAGVEVDDTLLRC